MAPSTLEPPCEWRLHIGAHKTATTHLQDTLELRRDALLKQGVDFLPMREVRALRLPPASGLFQWRRRLGWPMREMILEAVAPIRRGPRRIAVSEENFAGFVRDLLTTPLYPHLEDNLRPFASLAHTADVTVFLAIRSFDTLLASAYAQQMRFRPVPGGFEPLRAQALACPPSWLDVVQRIRRVLPKANIKLWRYEDYRANDWQVLSHFCGVDVPAGTRLPAPASTRSLSAQSIASLELLGNQLANEDYRKSAAEIARSASRGEPFRPFRPSEQEILREAYLSDINEIKRHYPDGVFLELEHENPL